MKSGLVGASLVPAAALAGPSANGDTGAGNGRTIAIIDDEASIRSLVRQVLGGEGYRVVEAADGAAALALVEREPGLDLVLLDLWMPVMDGWQFAAAYWNLKLGWPHPPVLAFTAEKGVVAAHMDQLRACGFLTKPFEIEELVAAVDRCVRRSPSRAAERRALPAAPVSSATPAAPVSSATPDTGAGRPTPAPRTAPSAASAPSAARTSPTEKLSREELSRLQQMARLQAHLTQLQHDMSTVRLGVSKVAAIESTRRLTREEARWAARLRLENERLRYELETLRSEFFRLRDERNRRSD